MHFEFVVSHQDLVELLDQIAPVRLHMTKVDEDRRWIELEKPSEVTLFPGEGLRLVSEGRLRYELLKVKIPAVIRRIQLMLRARVTHPPNQPPELVFDVDLEQADLKNIPDLIDDALVATINAALTSRATGLAWRFANSLTARFQLPSRIEPLEHFGANVTGGDVIIERDRLRFLVKFDAAFERSKERPTDDPRPPRDAAP